MQAGLPSVERTRSKRMKVQKSATRVRMVSLFVGYRFIGGGKGGVRRVRTAILGIALSLLPLLLVLQVAEGMILGIAERFIETGTGHLQARPRFAASVESYLRVAETVSAVPGVELANPEMQGLALVYSDRGRAGATVRGVSPSLWEQDHEFRRLIRLDDGEFDLSRPENAVIGRDMARRLGLSVGDTVRLLTVRTMGRDRVLPRVSTFVVAGIVSTGYQDLDRLWVFLSYERSRRVLSPESSSSRVTIKISDPFGMANPLFRGQGDGETTRRSVAAALPEGWILQDWFEIERSQYMSFVATRNLLIFVMFIIVCVAGVNIASTLATLSIEKREELAVLKSIGASPADIRLIFMSAGFLIGSIGTLLGIVFGLALAVHINELLLGLEFLIGFFTRVLDVVLAPLGINPIGTVDIISSEFYLEEIPIRINAVATVAAGALAVTLATVSSVIPARRASGIRPLEILRKH